MFIKNVLGISLTELDWIKIQFELNQLIPLQQSNQFNV